MSTPAALDTDELLIGRHGPSVLASGRQRTRPPWVIENVAGAPLRSPVMLCGSSFGLDVRRSVSAVRVVAGTLRGRRIVAPEGRATRPTSDKVRSAMFNALTSLDVVRDAGVVDLFAGSGALGIEALSRGARHCTFVEKGRPALGALRANIATLDLKDRAEIVDGDALRFVARRPGPHDLVLADPPYTFTGWPALLEILQAGFVVLESGRPVDPPERWVTVRERAYGGTVVTFLRPAG